MKRMVEQRNYSAFTVSYHAHGLPSFDHAALKNFDFQLREHHCKHRDTTHHHPCIIFVYTPPAHKAKPEGGPKPELCMVPTGDARRLTFEHGSELASGRGAQVPLTLSSHPGYAVVKGFPERREAFHEWEYTSLVIGPADGFATVTCAFSGGRLVDPTGGVITPSMLQVTAENHFDFVWHKSNPARLAEEAGKHGTQPCSFHIGYDGSATMAGRPDLCLGLQFSVPAIFAQPQQQQPQPAPPVPVVVAGIAVPVEAAIPMGAGVVFPAAGSHAQPPPLAALADIFRRELGVSGSTVVEVVNAAAVQLGIDGGKDVSLVQTAHQVWAMLGSPPA